MLKELLLPSHSSKTAESASSSEWMRAHSVFYCVGLRNLVGVYWRMLRDWCAKACAMRTWRILSG